MSAFIHFSQSPRLGPTDISIGTLASPPPYSITTNDQKKDTTHKSKGGHIKGVLTSVKKLTKYSTSHFFFFFFFGHGECWRTMPEETG
jgi:hypothetical protein